MHNAKSMMHIPQLPGSLRQMCASSTAKHQGLPPSGPCSNNTELSELQISIFTALWASGNKGIQPRQHQLEKALL